MGLLAFLTTWETSLIAILIALATFYIWRSMNFWPRRGIPHIPPEPLFGNFRATALLTSNQGEVIMDLYQKAGSRPFVGIYQLLSPALLVKDPEIIRQIMVKEFWSFQDRGIIVNPKRNPLTQHLLFLRGNVWKSLRAQISPTFTSGKMKMMYNIIDECAQQITQYLEDAADKGKEIEMKDKMATFTTDVIGSCVFGLQFNAMTDSNSQFRAMGKKATENTLTAAFRRNTVIFFPKLANLLKLSVFPKVIDNFFIGLVRDTISYREKNNVKRNDFIQLLMELKNKGYVEDEAKETVREDPLYSEGGAEVKPHHGIEITDEILASQAFVFFAAGFETSSTTISFALYELALHPDIQIRLREEIDRALEKYNGKFTYEAVMDMKYLDQVVSETLRMYPPIPLLLRECTSPTVIPGTKLPLEKGMRVILPVWALQRDPKYFPNPDVFNPEHFSNESKAQRPHYTYMPFGEGPRQCIGMRFGLLQSKLGLVHLLSKYQFTLGKNMPVPLNFEPRSFLTSSKEGIVLKITKRC